MLGVVELEPEAAVCDLVSKNLPRNARCEPTRESVRAHTHIIINPVCERNVTECVVQVVVFKRSAHL
jgi:hypothetical protein